MGKRQIIKHWLTHFLVLTLILFIVFWVREIGDITVVIFGTLIYLPFVFILTVTNIALVVIGLQYFKTSSYKLIPVLFTTTLLTGWYCFKSGQIKIHFWEINQTEFIIFNIILVILNLTTVYMTARRKIEVNT